MIMATGTVPGADDLGIEEAKKRSTAGPRMLFASRMVLLLMTFVSTATVARLVAPREYGLAAMSAVILTFAQVFRDFGVTNAVLRKGHITEDELTLIFWFNLFSTTTLSLILIGLAPLAAHFYHEPIVFWTMLVSLIGFQIGGMALQHRALINRSLRFGSVAMIEISGIVVGFATTLVLALIRHDVWAIVIGNVAQSVTGAALSIGLSRWRPGAPRHIRDLRDLVRFGANSTVHALSILISNNIGVLLVGHAFGAALVGQYNRAQNLFAVPNTNLIQPITQTTMPLLTRLRAVPEEYRTAYLGLVRRLCVFLMPLSVTLAFISVPLVRVLLGERWHMAGSVLAVLAPALAFMGIAYAVSDVMITQNRSSEMRNLGILELFVRVGSIVVGVQFGLVQTALGFTVSTIVVTFVRVIVAGRKGPVTARDQINAAVAGLPAAAASAAACGLLYAVRLADGLPALLGTGVAGVVGAFLGGLLTGPSRQAMLELLESFGGARMVRRRASNPVS